MGLCLDCFKKSVKKSKSPQSGGVLKKAQVMKKTASGKSINSELNKKLISKAELDRLCLKSMFLKKLAHYTLIEFTKITNDLFLTGYGGIVKDNFKMFGISCLINATFETPLLKVSGIESIRVPVEDEMDEKISIYFDDVSDQIDKWIRNRKKVVIHCLCGVSRSTTLVLAYLIKYKGWDLKRSYEFIKLKRRVIQPNPSFFQQLIDYEKRILKKTSVKMIGYTLKNGRTIKVPDFILRQYPEETDREDLEHSLDSTLGSSLFSIDSSTPGSSF